MSFNDDNDDVAIRVANLSKCYEIYASPRDRLKQFILPRLQRQFGKLPGHYFREFWALKDISFDVKKGETVGIIGRNGSGKSTLLQMICGTLTPTDGTVQINGRVAALLELGSGFNPEFSGRENVFLNATVLGLSYAEISERFNDIVTFADIGDFINQPVKTYSSGMFVRLAFAVIAHVEANILVIDEALSVGDVFFQQKCMRFLRAHQEKGGTVIFVSHDTSAVVGLCDKALLLSRERNAVVGSADEIAKLYIKDLYAEREAPSFDKPSGHHEIKALSSVDGSQKTFKGEEQPCNLIRITPFRKEAESFGNGGGQIIDTWFENFNNEKILSLLGGDSVRLCLKVKACQKIANPAFGFMIKDRLGQYVFAEGSDLAFRSNVPSIKAGDVAIVKFSFLMPILIMGEYSLNVAFADGVGDNHIQHHWINDVMALHSMKSRLVHGICGLQNLAIEMTVPLILEAE